jgi:Amidases related to nicotinamidase
MPKPALILVDIQNDYFEGGRWPVHEMDRVGENAARLLAAAREAGDTIIHVRHEIPSDEAPFFRPGSEGAQINAVVAPVEGEPVLLKNRPNSFVGTDLLERLKAAGAQEVTICGAMSQMCIDATARAAADHGFKVTVVEDACGPKETAFNGTTVPAPLVHAAIMGALSGTYAKVVSTQDYLKG